MKSLEVGSMTVSNLLTSVIELAEIPGGSTIDGVIGHDALGSLRYTIDRDRIVTPPGPPRVFVRYPDWSARGDLLVFERSEMTGNIWLIDRRADAD